MRPATEIPDEVKAPYPIHLESHVISGFGRGSAELGIPTANIPINAAINSLEAGIYFGVCKLSPRKNSSSSQEQQIGNRNIRFNFGNYLEGQDLDIQPMVMSVGWNPYYNNSEKAAEAHIIHSFKENFYGAEIKVTVLGYIRPELNYTTKV